jgi:hypothetical protein
MGGEVDARRPEPLRRVLREGCAEGAIGEAEVGRRNNADSSAAIEDC